MWAVYAQGIAEYFACYVDDEEAKVFQETWRERSQAKCFFGI